MSNLLTNKRGIAYQCVRCLQRTGKTYITEKYRLVDHIQQKHLAQDEVAFYCSLCLFRCTTRQELQKHVTMARHCALAAQNGITNHESCFRHNPNHHVIGDGDMRALTSSESAAFWASRSRKDPVARAVDLTFPNGLLAEMDQEEEHQIADDIPVAAHPSIPSNQTTLQGSPKVQGALLSELSKLVGGTVLQSLLGLAAPSTTTGLASKTPETAAPTTWTMPDASLTPPVTPAQPTRTPTASLPSLSVLPALSPAIPATPARMPVASLPSPYTPAMPRMAQTASMLSLSVPATPMRTPIASPPPPPAQAVAATPAPSHQEEDILGQLLPAENTNILETPTATQCSLPPSSPPTKRARMMSPERMTNLDTFTQALTSLQEEVRQSARTMARELECNTRATRCMDKSIQELGISINRLAGVMEREARQRDQERRRRSRSRHRRSQPNTTTKPSSPRMKSTISKVKKHPR